MNRKNPHVVPIKRGEQWAIKIEGNKRETSLHNTQKDAIEAAREIAIKNKAELFIHNRQGKIREKNSYGNDPNPPKG
ncbi:MAG: DUF2188 domain-containing protein [Gammaproteobacteria bacterium]|nr:MAG: DUF2188 domain-containing protein [Gammaproteobacteria bacterium]